MQNIPSLITSLDLTINQFTYVTHLSKLYLHVKTIFFLLICNTFKLKCNLIFQTQFILTLAITAHHCFVLPIDISARYKSCAQPFGKVIN